MKTTLHHATPAQRINARPRNILLGIGLVALIIGAQGLADRIDRHTDEQIRLQKDIADYRRWVAEACTPGPDEKAVAEREGKKLHCTIYTNTGYGMAPVVVSAAVMEIPL
jgi:hypothetical protein